MQPLGGQGIGCDSKQAGHMSKAMSQHSGASMAAYIRSLVGYLFRLLGYTLSITGVVAVGGHSICFAGLFLADAGTLLSRCFLDCSSRRGSSGLMPMSACSCCILHARQQVKELCR